MTDPLIPDDLRDFILKHIDSIAELEALLLLRRDSTITWEIPKLATRLYASEQQVAEAVSHLQADGFLTAEESGYRYDSRAPEQEEMVKRLAELYSRNLIPVTNLIHSKPRRIREFAQAFRLRKDS